MKKITVILASILSLGINSKVFSQSNNVQDNKSLLWKISGKQLSKPSYLFGTMHLICANDFVWTNKMKESLDKSEKICFEMNLGDPKLMMETSALMIDKTGKKLKDYFTPEQYKIISKYVKDNAGIDISIFENMKPMVLEGMLISNEVNCPNPISYEDTIMKTGQKSKKEIMGLEEPKEQIEAFESIPTDSFVNSLMEQITHPNNDDTSYQQLINAYKIQDLPSLYEQIIKSKELGDNMGALLYDRNSKWIGRMTDKMNKSSVFFAVGAGHLWGDKGVITLLRKNGYTVEAIK